MRRVYIILSLFAFLFAISACEKSATETKPPNVANLTPTPATAPSIPKNGDYPGKGEVTGINMEAASIKLKHEEIKDMMPAMEMDFFVKDKAMLKGLAVGDKVDFVIEYKHPTEVISSIKKTP